MGRPGLPNFPLRMLIAPGLCMALLWTVSCSSHESDQRIQQQAEQATERAKIAARQAAADAEVAARNAARDTRDIAKGVKEGLQNKTPGRTRTVDINSASRAELETLPGVDRAVALRIQARRPYTHARDLVRKGAVSASEYERIAGDVAAD